MQQIADWLEELGLNTLSALPRKWHERVWLVEILRLKGWVLMRQDRRTVAETQLRASIQCAPAASQIMGVAQFDDAR